MRRTKVILPQVRMVCPYCYERFNRWEILFQCSGRRSRVGSRCDTVPDPAYAARFGGAEQLPVFSARRRREAIHAPCAEKTTFRVCPHCHHRLPASFERVRSRMVAIVGSRSSGKTVMMAVLIKELRGAVGKRLGLAVWEADEETRRAFVTDYEMPVYGDDLVPAGTVPIGARPELRAPLVFEVVETGRRRGRSRRTLLSFFDTAGEDLRSVEGVENNTRYLRSADAVLLLLDPKQTKRGRDEAEARDTPTTSAVPDYDAFDVLRRITDLIRSGRRSNTVSKPMAVALSKIDLYRKEMQQTDALLRPEPEEKGFPEVDGADVHAQVDRLLHEWDGPQIPDFLQTTYRRSWGRPGFHYFGFSALGHEPSVDGRIAAAGVRPYRVVDPFLWLLTQLGAARTIKGH